MKPHSVKSGAALFVAVMICGVPMASAQTLSEAYAAYQQAWDNEDWAAAIEAAPDLRLRHDYGFVN